MTVTERSVGVTIIIAIIGGIAVLAWNIYAALGGHHDKATVAAQEWARRMGQPAHVECVRTDNDGDGYISCTLFLEGKDPVFIECAGMGLNEGCRAAKLRVQ